MKLKSILCVALSIAAIEAQADTGLPRYVAQEGEDVGQCQNMFRPCRSLVYAVKNSTKTDRIYAASGEYPLANADQVYSVGSAAFRIYGGYSRISGYSEQDSSRFISTVIGLPPLYREAFQNSGFKVIADQKGLTRGEMQTVREKMQRISRTLQNHGVGECVDNEANGYGCEYLDLYSHLNLSSLKTNASSGNDIWGYYDLNTGKEYVLMGVDNGVAIVDATDPEHARVVATTDGPNSLWRDIKVYQRYDAMLQRWQAYAYVSNESGNGVAILDLNQLPNHAEVLSRGGGVSSAHNVYLANVDFTFAVSQPGLQALLSVAGANTNGGNFRLYALSQPESPVYITTNTYGYMHDAASVRIRDDRKNTQCEHASAAIACQVLADFNEGSVEIFDITNAEQPTHLATINYSGASYVHSGWWSEDGRYLFVQDELDEAYNFLYTTLRIWNMDDLQHPLFAGTWTGTSRAIDHNGFVKGNRYYMSNYTEGLTVLDISDPDQPTLRAYFDTVPGISSTSFSGAWGVYPFFVSDLLAVSDINSGLYLIKDKSLQSPQGALSFSASHYSATEGEEITVSVERTNGSDGEVSVNAVLVPLTADETDVNFEQNSPLKTLHWAEGDSEAKTLSLSINTDAEVEGIEQFALRLETPSQGATVANHRIAIFAVSEPDTQAALTFLNSSVNAQSSTDEVTVSILRKRNVQLPVSAQLHVSYPADSALNTQAFDLQWSAGDVQAKNIVIPLGSANFASGDTIELRLENTVNAASNENSVASIIIGSDGVNPSSSPTPPVSSSSSSGGGKFRGGSGGGAVWQLLFVLLGLLPVLAMRNWRRN